MPEKKRAFDKETDVRKTVHLKLKISKVLDKSFGKTPEGQDARDEWLTELIENAHANHDAGELSENRASNPLAKFLKDNIDATAEERKISRNAAFDLEVAALTKGRDTRLSRATKATVEA
jgi:hypothetical protein